MYQELTGFLGNGGQISPLSLLFSPSPPTSANLWLLCRLLFGNILYFSLPCRFSLSLAPPFSHFPRESRPKDAPLIDVEEGPERATGARGRRTYTSTYACFVPIWDSLCDRPDPTYARLRAERERERGWIGESQSVQESGIESLSTLTGNSGFKGETATILKKDT